MEVDPGAAIMNISHYLVLQLVTTLNELFSLN